MNPNLNNETNLGDLVIYSFPAGPLQCNCSIIGNKVEKQAVIVDPGGDHEHIVSFLNKHELTPTEIIHTHAHFDHCLATYELKQLFPEAVIRLHEKDKFLYDIIKEQCRMFGIRYEGNLAAIDSFIDDGAELKLGSGKIDVMHTPGHTPGSCCFVLSDQKQFLFAGDTLFAGGIGRTDLWGGDYKQIMDSIKNRLLKLDRETVVITGHGSSTTIENELKTNPFL